MRMLLVLIAQVFTTAAGKVKQKNVVVNQEEKLFTDAWSPRASDPPDLLLRGVC